MAMIFKYSADFAAELKAKVAKTGIKLFLSEALASLEDELNSRPSGFIASLETGKGVVLALEAHGKVQIVRGEAADLETGFMIRFMNAPQCVLLASLVREEGQEMGEASQLDFVCVALLVEQGSAGKARSQVAEDRQM